MDIKEYIRNLKQDKLLHFIAGILMVDVFFIVLNIIIPFHLASTIAFGVASLVMLGKEIIYDKMMNKGVCSTKDFLAGEIGIVLQCVAFLLYEII